MSLDEIVRSDPPSEPAAPPNADSARVPALDGVRAIAIILVLLFHNYEWELGGSHSWAGGYLGVDMFFVLSGFLITSLLLHEHGRAQRIDLPRFWSRRARRLLPALFVAVIGSALLAKFVYDPVTGANLRGESISALFYVENWYRLNSASTTSVLSHTWSLSVEEQWYLMWPLLLGGLLLWTRGRKRVLLAVIVALAAASAIECALLFSGTGSRDYNGTDTRAQTLLVGAALAVLLFNRSRVPSRLLQVGGWVAAALIAWTVSTVKFGNDEAMYKGGFLLFAIAVALLIAAVVQSEGGPLGRALAFRPLAAIGLISYGLYLYHLPIYAWLNVEHTHLHGLALLGARLTVTAAVAIASYFLVERPLRRGPTLDYRRVAAFASVGALAVVTVLVATPSSIPSPIAKVGRLFALVSNETPRGAQRVLVAGDWPAFELGRGGIYDDGAIRGASLNMFGCDLTPGAAIVDGQRIPASSTCAQPVPWIRQLTRIYNPAVTVLMVGPEDARDRGVGSHVLRSGSPALRDLIVGRLDRLQQALTVTGARFVLLPVQCDRTTGVPAAGVDWLNQVLARYAQARPHAVTYIPDLTQPCTATPPDPKTTWQRIAAAVERR